MKILYDHQIFSNQSYGGPSRYYVKLAEKIYELEQNPEIISGFHINEHLNDIKYKRIVAGKKIPFSKFLNKSSKSKYILRKINQNFFLRQSENKSPDVIHYTYFDNINVKIKCKKIVTVYDLIHEIFYNEYKRNQFYRPKKEIIQKADNVICISNSTKNDLIKYYDVDEKKLQVIYLGNDIKKVTLKFPKYDKYLNLPFILYVGKRHGYKNFDNLLKTFSENISKLKDIYIVCFGGGEFNKQEIKKAKDLKLDLNKLIFVDGNDELLSLFYQNARLFVYPSKYEGFGLPILEAFINECPVICSNTSSLPEVGGDAVSYFDPYDTGSIFESMYKTIFDDSFRKELILKGKKQNKLFSWEKTALNHINLYKC